MFKKKRLPCREKTEGASKNVIAGVLTRRDFLGSIILGTTAVSLTALGSCNASTTAAEGYIPPTNAPPMVPNEGSGAEVASDRKYTLDHIWVKELSDGFWVLGVSDKLVKLLKVVTIVTLDNSGTQELRGYPFGYIESAKMNTDLISPISGKIVQTNSQVLQHINDQPYTGGWMIVIEPDKVEEMDDLMSAKEYAAFAWNKTQN